VADWLVWLCRTCYDGPGSSNAVALRAFADRLQAAWPVVHILPSYGSATLCYCDSNAWQCPECCQAIHGDAQSTGTGVGNRGPGRSL